jgi:hypothetical protein
MWSVRLLATTSVAVHAQSAQGQYFPIASIIIREFEVQPFKKRRREM